MARRPVDEKIIKLSMDNRDLARKASESTSLLDKLRNGLNKIPGINLGKTTQEISKLGNSVKGVDYAHMHEGIDVLTNRFSTFGIMGQEVIRRLTNAGIDFVTGLGKAVWNQAMTAGKRRATNIEQAAFQFKGLGIDVEKAMAAAEYATTGTTFGLDEAAVAASQLGASGIEAGDDMGTALRAISGVAAMTNSEYSDTAHIFTTVAGNGRLMTDQMRQLATRGLNVAAILAKSFGVSEQKLREMVTAGEVDFETFYKAMDEAFGEHATSNRDTFTGAMAAMKASVTRIGATIWTPILEHGRPVLISIMEFINGIHNALKPIVAEIEPMMKSAFESFSGFLEGVDFTNLAPTLMALFKGIVNIGTAIGRIVGPLLSAFTNLFSFGGSPILNLAEGFEWLTSKLIISKEVSESLGTIFSKVTGVIRDLIGGVFNLSASFTESFPSMSSVVRTFSLGTATALSNIGTWLGTVLSGSSFSGLRRMGEVITSLTDMFNHHYSETSSVFKALYEMVKEYLSSLNISFESFSDFVKSLATAVGNFLEPVWELVKDIFSGVDFRHFLGGGFLVGVWGIVKKIIENMDGLSGIWKGITDFIDVLKDKSGDSTSFLDRVAGSLTGFSDALKEGVTLGRILSIATAIGILAVAMKILEDLDTAQITRGMVAIATSMATLSWGMKALDGVDIGGVGGLKVIAFATAISILVGAVNKVSDIDGPQVFKGVLTLAAVTATLVAAFKVLDGVKVGTGPVTMIAMAGAIKILVSTLSDIDEVRVEGLIKGLGTIGILLAELAVFARVMDGVKIRPTTVLSIAGIAGVIKILVGAIKEIDTIRVEGLIKGLGTIGILLAEIAIFGNVMKGVRIGPSMAIGVLGIAQAMVIMSDAIKQIDDIRVEGLIKGLGTIGTVLAAIAVFANVTRETKLVTAAAGVAIIAGAITILVPPLKEMGEMRWQDLVKGLGGLAVALGAMAIAGRIASGTLTGAIAITVMAASLTLLIDPIERLSEMTWGELLSNLGKLAVVVGVVAGASLLLLPAVGPMLAFSGALAVFGAAVALIGGGLALFGTGLTLLAGLTVTSVASIIAAVELLIEGLIGIIGSIGDLISAVIRTVAEVVTESAHVVVGAVIALLFAMLDGIDENIEGFIERGVSIVLKLIEGIDSNAEELMTAGVGLVVTLIDALAVTIDKEGPRLVKSIVKLVGSILIILVEAGTELALILFGWIPGARGAITSLGNDMTTAIRESFGLDEEVELNLQRGGKNIEKAGPGFRSKTGNLGDTSSSEFDKKFILDKYGKENVGKLVQAIEDGKVPVKRSGAGLARSGRDGAKSVSWFSTGRSLAQGLVNGVGALGSSLWTTASNLANSALRAVKNVFKTQSPSKVTTEEGMNFGQGLANGIERMTSKVGTSARGMALQAVDTTNHFLESLMTDMDREVHMKLVLDTSEVDNWSPEDLQPLRPNTSFTNRMMSESIPETHQNENSLYRNDNEPKGTNEYNYDVHIHATGELPRSTIRRMATDFKEEIEMLDRRDRVNRGEEVVF